DYKDKVMDLKTDVKREILDDIENMGLEACTNLDRLKFELFRAEQELGILEMKREFFKQFPDKFLKTKAGNFISSGDKEHSEHAKHAIVERIKQFKKELKAEKIKLAFIPGYEDYIAEESHLKIIRGTEA